MGRVRIIVRSETREQLLEILRREELDLNCGGPRETPSHDAWVVEAYVSEEQASRLQAAGLRVDIDKDFEERSSNRRAEVEHGDRFEGGRRPPRGIGRKE